MDVNNGIFCYSSTLTINLSNMLSQRKNFRKRLLILPFALLLLLSVISTAIAVDTSKLVNKMHRGIAHVKANTHKTNNETLASLDQRPKILLSELPVDERPRHMTNDTSKTIAAQSDSNLQFHLQSQAYDLTALHNRGNSMKAESHKFSLQEAAYTAASGTYIPTATYFTIPGVTVTSLDSISINSLSMGGYAVGGPFSAAGCWSYYHTYSTTSRTVLVYITGSYTKVVAVTFSVVSSTLRVQSVEAGYTSGSYYSTSCQLVNDGWYYRYYMSAVSCSTCNGYGVLNLVISLVNQPSYKPTARPTAPTIVPTVPPTSRTPTRSPTRSPTFVPSVVPSSMPLLSAVPSVMPTQKPTVVPSINTGTGYPTFKATSLGTVSTGVFVPTTYEYTLPGVSVPSLNYITVMNAQLGGYYVGGPFDALSPCLSTSHTSTASIRTYLYWIAQDYIKVVAVQYTSTSTGTVTVRAIGARYVPNYGDDSVDDYYYETDDSTELCSAVNEVYSYGYSQTVAYCSSCTGYGVLNVAVGYTQPDPTYTPTEAPFIGAPRNPTFTPTLVPTLAPTRSTYRQCPSFNIGGSTGNTAAYCYIDVCGQDSFTLNACGSCTGSVYVGVYDANYNSIQYGGSECDATCHDLTTLYTVPGSVSDCSTYMIVEICSNDACSGQITVQGLSNTAFEPSFQPTYSLAPTSAAPTRLPTVHLAPGITVFVDAAITSVGSSDCNTRTSPDDTLSGSCSLERAMSYCNSQLVDNCHIQLPERQTFIIADNGVINVVATGGKTINIFGNNAVVTLQSFGNPNATGVLFSTTVQRGADFRFNVYDLTLTGGLLLNGVTYSTFRSVIFTENKNSTALSLVNSNHITIENCMFTSNSARISATGASLSLSDSRYISVTGTTFQGNAAGSSGGGAMYISGVAFLTVDKCAFSQNLGTGNGGALYITETSQVTVKNSTFIGNSAFSGGAVYLNTLVTTTMFLTNDFSGNHANEGGAVYVETKNTGISFRSSRFYANYAIEDAAQGVIVIVGALDSIELYGGHGGGIYVGVSNAYISVLGCSFVDNFVGDKGGAVYLQGPNIQVTVVNSIFNNNTAVADGGAVYLVERNLVTFTNDTFIRNTAGGAGGAVLMSEQNKASFILSSFTHNVATESGGAVAMVTNNVGIVIKNSIFRANVAAVSGAAIFSVAFNDELAISDTQFYKHTSAKYGGAVFIGLSHKLVSFKTCTILGNSAEVGGGVYINILNQDSSFTTSVFENNIATNGGALYMGGTGTTIKGCTFRNNTATTDTGGAVQMIDSTNTEMTYTSFYNNYAQAGGGALFITSSRKVIISECTVQENTVSSDGAGFYFSSCTEVNLVNSNFTTNTAAKGSGGAMYIDDSAIFVTSSCIFTSNSAVKGFGGGIYYSMTVTNIYVDSSSFTANSAKYGAGLYYLSASVLDVSLSTFSHNIVSVSGGGIYASGAVTQLAIAYCSFTSNNAIVTGGAIAVTGDVDVTEVYIRFSKFTSNSAKASGGAIDLNAILTGAFRRNAFTSNYAGEGRNVTGFGGAVAIQKNHDLLFENNTFTTNLADSAGSSLYLNAANLTLNDNTFESNKAYRGGAVFWTTTSDMNEPISMRNSSINRFTNNIASYGPNWATNGISLQSVHDGTIVSIAAYEDTVPAIVFTLHDFYDQLVNTESTRIVTVTTSANETLHPYDCGADTIPVVGGGTTVKFVNGVASFAFLQLQCSPKGNMPLIATTSVTDWHLFSDVLQLSFRACQRGEYFANKRCIACGEGFYSLANNTDLGIAACMPCPQGAKSCRADVIELANGYWRVSDSAYTPLFCPLEGVSCKGGEVVGEELCEVGYEGPLCSICSEGYYFNSLRTACNICTKANFSPFAIVVLSIFGFLTILVLIGLIYAWCKGYLKFDDAHAMSVDSVLASIFDRAAKEGDDRAKKMQQLRSRLQSKFKIYVTLYQILSSLPFVLNLQFPPIWTRMSSVVKFFNFNFTADLGLACKITYDYIDMLVVSTLGPIFVIAAIFLLQTLHVGCIETFRRRDTSDVELFKRTNRKLAVKSNYFFLFLIFTYLILPSVSTNIFRVFSIDNIDPDDVSDEYSWYMRADYSIAINSDKYLFGRIYATCMIFVYPVGIPAYYFWVLYCARDAIKRRIGEKDRLPVSEGGLTAKKRAKKEAAIRAQDEFIKIQQQEQSTKKHNGTYVKRHWLVRMFVSDEIYTDDQRMRPLKFLFLAYEPKYWYWEVIETVQRLMLTGVLVLIMQGSSLQIIIACVIALSFTKLYGLYQPFENDDDDIDKELAQWQVFASLFLGLIIKGEFLNQYMPLLNVLLVFAMTTNAWVDLFKMTYPSFEEYATAHHWIGFRNMKVAPVESSDDNDDDDDSVIILDGDKPVKDQGFSMPVTPLSPQTVVPFPFPSSATSKKDDSTRDVEMVSVNKNTNSLPIQTIGDNNPALPQSLTPVVHNDSVQSPVEGNVCPSSGQPSWQQQQHSTDQLTIEMPSTVGNVLSDNQHDIAPVVNAPRGDNVHSSENVNNPADAEKRGGSPMESDNGNDDHFNSISDIGGDGLNDV